MLILLPTDSKKLLMQWRGPYSVEMETKTYHVNMFMKYISREPDVVVNVVPTKMEDGGTVAVASVIHQDIDPELGEVPDLEGCRQKEGV